MAELDRKYLQEELVPAPSVWQDAWPLARIQQAINQHDLGTFYLSDALGRRVLREPPILAAYNQRTAPSMAILPHVTGPDPAIEKEASAFFPAYRPGQRVDLGACSPSTRRRLLGDMATYGVAFAQVTWEPRSDGTRIDGEVTPWPVSATCYDRTARQYYAHTQWWGRVPISTDDGKWVSLRPFGEDSHQFGALRALGIVYACSGLARRDQSGSSALHGYGAWTGEMPEGVPVDGPEGKLMQEALDVILRGRGRVALPHGANVKLIEALSTAWQIFPSILRDSRAAALLAYCGQDGTGENSGGSYTKALILENVLFSLIESDLTELSAGLTRGFLRPWTLLNVGDAALTPVVYWPLPDLEEDTRIESIGKRHKLYAEALEAHRRAGNAVTQEYADRLARSMSVEPLPLETPSATT